jgi:hypothetical protein
VTGLVAHLPDALVGIPPALADEVRVAAQHAPVALGELASDALIEPGGLEELAVAVELGLAGGSVADAHGARAAVPREMVELDLGQGPSPLDAVHDPEVFGTTGAGALDEALEGGGLAREATHHERGESQGRVADPGVAIVPVARAAEGLRERGRRRRDDGARRGEGQRLQDQRRASGQPGVLARGGARVHPAPPEGDRRLQPFGVESWGGLEAPLLVGSAPAALDPHLVACAQGPAPTDARVGLLEPPGRRHEDRVGAAHHRRLVLRQQPEAGYEGSVLEARRQRDPQHHLASQATGPPQDGVPRSRPLRVVRSGLERHAVDQLKPAGRSLEARGEDVGVREVAPGGRGRPLGRGAERAAAIGVEDAAEDGG